MAEQNDQLQKISEALMFSERAIEDLQAQVDRLRSRNLECERRLAALEGHMEHLNAGAEADDPDDSDDPDER